MTYDEAYHILVSRTQNIPKKAPDEDIALVWSKMVEFEKRWYLAFLLVTRYKDWGIARVLATLAGIDSEQLIQQINRASYVQNQELIDLTVTKYWDYISGHSERKEARKARRKRRPSPQDPDTCQKEVDWDASYWFSEGVVDVYEMRGKRRPDDKEYTQQPAWWPK